MLLLFVCVLWYIRHCEDWKAFSFLLFVKTEEDFGLFLTFFSSLSLNLSGKVWIKV